MKIMKKIMFNDEYGLETAVLQGQKIVTRRICSIQPPYENYGIAFPVFAGNGEKSPLYGAFCWTNKDNPEEFTKWCIPKYKEGDIVVIAQCYKALGYDPESLDRDPGDLGIRGFMKDSAGWNNKMFVRTDACKHKIRIKKIGIERLQKISDEDCLKEGIYKLCSTNGNGGIAYSFVGSSSKKHIGLYASPREAFAALIDKISGKGTWDKNPWVWRYEFELVKSE